MHLRRIEADRLRNLKAVQLDLPQGLTVISGKNGQGKSSLLEAIYLLGTGRSFRTRRLEELIAWDGGPLRVAGSLQSNRGANQLTVVMDGAERGLLVDGVARALELFLEHLVVVDLTGDRMKVLKEGPEHRRRFLDRGIVGLEPAFLRELGEYRRVLQHRNALLKSLKSPRAGRPGSVDAELDTWDQRLVECGRRVYHKRRSYAESLDTLLDPVAEVLFPGGSGKLRVVYEPSPRGAGPADPADFEAIFQKSLEQGRRRDQTLGHTFDGPHRDDLNIELDGVDLRKFGSAGQIRASLVALKLGKLSRAQQGRGEPPLFLMDDFDSDLDEPRASTLARYLNEAGFQSLVATSKETLADRLGVPCVRIRIREGRAEVI